MDKNTDKKTKILYTNKYVFIQIFLFFVHLSVISLQLCFYLIHVGEIDPLTQFFQLSLIRYRHLGGVFDVGERVWSVSSPTARPRGGLRGYIVGKATSHHHCGQLFLIFIRRSVGFLLGTPILTKKKIIMQTLWTKLNRMIILDILKGFGIK